MAVGDFISKEELKYIGGAVAFALIWFFLILPGFLTYLDGDNNILQFFIFNIGLYAFFFIFLKSQALERKANFAESLKFLLVILAIDTWIPEYHVNFITGELIKGATFGISATDYTWGYIAQIAGLGGIAVTFFTYILMPGLLLVLASLVHKNFVEKI